MKTPDTSFHRSRRDFLRLAGTIVAGTTCVPAVEPESPQIGILLATTFTTGTLEARLDAARACGLTCVQMSMACANLPEMPMKSLPNCPRGCVAKRRLAGSQLAA